MNTRSMSSMGKKRGRDSDDSQNTQSSNESKDEKIVGFDTRHTITFKEKTVSDPEGTFLSDGSLTSPITPAVLSSQEVDSSLETQPDIDEAEEKDEKKSDAEVEVETKPLPLTRRSMSTVEFFSSSSSTSSKAETSPNKKIKTDNLEGSKIFKRALADFCSNPALQNLTHEEKRTFSKEFLYCLAKLYTEDEDIKSIVVNPQLPRGIKQVKANKGFFDHITIDAMAASIMFGNKNSTEEFDEFRLSNWSSITFLQPRIEQITDETTLKSVHSLRFIARSLTETPFSDLSKNNKTKMEKVNEAFINSYRELMKEEYKKDEGQPLAFLMNVIINYHTKHIDLVFTTRVANKIFANLLHKLGNLILNKSGNSNSSSALTTPVARINLPEKITPEEITALAAPFFAAAESLGFTPGNNNQVRTQPTALSSATTNDDAPLSLPRRSVTRR